MGKQIDKSIDSSKETASGIIEKTVEKIEEIRGISEGPAERAGKKIDEALENAAEKIEETGNTLKEKADEASNSHK